MYKCNERVSELVDYSGALDYWTGLLDWSGVHAHMSTYLTWVGLTVATLSKSICGFNELHMPRTLVVHLSIQGLHQIR